MKDIIRSLSATHPRSVIAFDCPGCGETLSFELLPYAFKAQGPEDESGRRLYYAADPAAAGELVHVCDLDQLREHRVKRMPYEHDSV